MKCFQQPHRGERLLTQLIQDDRVMLVLKEHTEAAQRLIHFLIAGQMLSIWRTELLGGFAFGKGMIGNAVFCHQARRMMCELFAHQIAARLVIMMSRYVVLAH